MLGTGLNVLIFFVFLVLLLIEYLLSTAVGFSYLPILLITTVLYLIFVGIQAAVKLNEDMERKKVKEILSEVMDAINGIPLVNKNSKIIIKWDIIFKKLIDKKEFGIYNSLLKINTNTIDRYVNLDPSLLLEDTELRESKYNADLESLITGSGKGKKKADTDKDLVSEEEIKKRIFIKDLRTDNAVFTNYDSTIHFDILLNDENLEAGASKIEGFSVVALYRNNKYVIVPPFFVPNKRIDKERWFLRNIESLLKCANSILNGDESYSLALSEEAMADYLLEPAASEKDSLLRFTFESLQDKFLVFRSTSGSKDTIKVYCDLATGYNSFELILQYYEKPIAKRMERIEVHKTVVMGSSYQPLVSILEKMQFIINNIELVMNKKDLTDIIIK